MKSGTRIEIANDNNVLIVYKNGTGNLVFEMHHVDPKEPHWFEVDVDTNEFLALLQCLVTHSAS